jgi:hypothetical protein
MLPGKFPDLVDEVSAKRTTNATIAQLDQRFLGAG